MAKDVNYTNGAIAVKETSLLKDKIFKLCEMSAEEAFRTLTENGFGRGAEVSSVFGYEALAEADERDLDGFIREYAPNDTYRAYLLAPRDFHNAKALVKAAYLGVDADKMLAPQGLIPVSRISECFDNGDFEALGKELGEAAEKACSLFAGGEGTASGAEIGAIFEKALFDYLKRLCARNGLLKKLVAAKADMTNILTALRSNTPEYAADNYVCGGKLGREQLDKLFVEDTEKAAHALDGTDYEGFCRTCFGQKSEGKPLTESERVLDSLETDCLARKKYELKNAEPFLYYVFRRRAENANVRIILVCLLAGMDEQDIKKRLRAI